jgi:uncharacterized protein (TIGR01655 family)
MLKMNIIKTIAVIMISVTVIAVVFWFKQYYENRYVLDDYYYTVVPLDYDITPERMYNIDGAHMGYEKEYELVCYNAGGEQKTLRFRAMLRFQELYPPGTYVRVSASKTTVLRQNALDAADIPEAALNKINENFTPSSASSLTQYANERTLFLSERNTPSLKISCAPAESENALIYTYLYSADAKEAAEAAAEYQDFVYRAQFRADKDTFPELSAIFLEIKLDDGTLIYSQKYDKRVLFGYDKEPQA